MTKKIFLITVLLFILSLGNVRAQEVELPNSGILPTSPVYFLKSWAESIRTFFTFGELEKAERFVELSEIRLAEINALVDGVETEVLEKVLGKYEKQLNMALEKAENTQTKGLDADEILEKIVEATMRHQLVLESVYERVPEQAKMSIQMVMQKSMQRSERVLERISERNRSRVTNKIQQRVQQNERIYEKLKERGIQLPNQVEIIRIEQKVKNLERKMQGFRTEEGVNEGINQEIQQVREQIQNINETEESNSELEQIRTRLNEIQEAQGQRR